MMLVFSIAELLSMWFVKSFSRKKYNGKTTRGASMDDPKVSNGQCMRRAVRARQVRNVINTKIEIQNVISIIIDVRQAEAPEGGAQL